MNMPTAQACGDLPQLHSILNFDDMATRCSIHGSGAFLSLYGTRTKFAKRLSGMLRDGACINDTKRIIARARLTSVLLMLSIWHSKSVRDVDGRCSFLWSHIEQTNKIGKTYYEVAMVPERIAEQWLGEPSYARLNHISD